MADPGKVEESDKNPSNLIMFSPQSINVPMHTSSSSGSTIVLGYIPYPARLATYQDVVANAKLFLETLQKLHVAMGTKFKVPVMGGRGLDLYRLFLEVTKRGGIEKIVKDKKWKEVTATFNFPSKTTNASFMLRKHYFSLLHHYEQVYYFQALGWTPIPNGIYQSTYTTIHGGTNSSLLVPTIQPQVIRPGESTTQGATPASLVNTVVTGVIDGKFEGGYLVTVTIGDSKLMGVLYHPAQNATCQGDINVSSVRRRRKKSEIKKRDPAHPKPNIGSYNFFFADQNSRLKHLYQDRESREITRMIGELWTNMKEDEKAVYQEKAAIDKERYRKEMEEYKEKLRLEVISNTVPIQQRLPNLDAKIAEIKDYSEMFEDEVADDDEEDVEEEEDDIMSMSEHEEEAEEPEIKSSNGGVDPSLVQEAAEATLMLSKSDDTGAEVVRETQEEEQKYDMNVVSEDQDAEDSTE